MLVEHDENYKIMMNMKKIICDLVVKSVDHISSKHVLIKLTHEEPLPEMFPGQFVEVSMEGVDGVLLRRPISINFVDRTNNELWLMVAMVGKGTRYLGQVQVGDVVNCVLPLGNSFTMPNKSSERLLLVGGGVGVAPLLYMGAEMKRLGVEPTFLLGARSKGDLLELDLFSHYGRVCITTEDGTEGEKGFVTNHSILKKETFDRIVENYGININGNITDETFDKTDVIIIFSKWEVSNITSRVGGITFTFTGYKNNDGYCGTLYLASKAINTNCIYRDTTNISNESIESDETSESNLQVDTKYNVSITKEQASDIADAEAKNQKYQYQPWVSDFTSKNILSDGSEGNEISAELLYELDEIHRIYYWEEEWEKRDSNGNKLYYGQPMWCVRLGDKNDPLTSLYIYVDANNGNILGAGKASD